MKLKSGAYPKSLVLIGLHPTLSHWGAKNRRKGIPLNADRTTSDHQRCNIVMHSQTTFKRNDIKEKNKDYFLKTAIWGQFHQCFMNSFYAGRSQKRKKDSQVISVFLCFRDLPM